MNILITGGSGYIGKSIINHLSTQKYNIFYPTRLQCDFTNKQQVDYYFKDRFFDIVIHCATDGRNYLDYKNTCLYNNLIMIYNIIQNKQSYSKLLIFSSGGQFRNLNNIDPYDFSKKIITDISNNYNFIYTIKIWNIFDQNQLQSRFIKSNIKRYINKQSMIINNNMYFDFFHMKDFLKIVDNYISNKFSFKQFYCAYYKKRTLLEITEYINTLSNYKVSIIIKNEDKVQDYVSNERCYYDNLEYYIKNMYNILKEVE